MASVQDRTKLKRVSYDTWSTREQLCLASSVLKSGDQNWIGVSRSLRPFAEKESLRPPDWFSQKSCAMQYAILLENADAPKRKKRESGETSGESIVRRLTQERIAELGQILAFQRDEYQQLKAEVNLLRSGSITEEKLQRMWLAIEQEEREQEQKARAHLAWLAKRQQKQAWTASQSLQAAASAAAAALSAPQKSSETETQETTELMTTTATIASSSSSSMTSNDEEEKKNRGGRSPLLTSLLKSPSPTTQIQNPPALSSSSSSSSSSCSSSSSSSSAQVTSPTIASLLGSSPKVPNPNPPPPPPPPAAPQTVQPQLHQLVSTTLANSNANAVSERPSIGAPTLSMLLELPANLQRGSLANLQAAAATASHQTPPPEIHLPGHPSKHISASASDASLVRQQAIGSAANNVPVTESMVQIIDHIDDVIRKDIMADVIDKDEINEIIGDIEELIKEEITSSPRKITERVSTPEIIEHLSAPEIEKVVTTGQFSSAGQERPEPRDVDEEPVSLSNSPQSEMAIEEIDQSTSSIAEIIGTVAIEPVEPKLTVAKAPEEKVTEVEAEDEEKEEKEEVKKVVQVEEESAEKEKKEEEEEEEKKEEEIEEEEANAEKIIEEVEEKSEEEKEKIVTRLTNEEKTPEMVEKSSPIESSGGGAEKEVREEATMAVTEAEESAENLVGRKEASEERKKKKEEEEEEKNVDLEMDQIEMDLAKITGDQNEAGFGEAGGSVSSEVTNDMASIADDNEKSQDISMILEDDDDESSRGSSSKKKEDADSQKEKEKMMAESARNEGSDSRESFREESKDAVKETANEASAEVDESTGVEATTEKDEEDDEDDENNDQEEEEEEEEDENGVKTETPKDSEDSLSPAGGLTEIEKSEKLIIEETQLSEAKENNSETVKSEGEEKENLEATKLGVEEDNAGAENGGSIEEKEEKREMKEENETDSLIEQLEGTTTKKKEESGGIKEEEEEAEIMMMIKEEENNELANKKETLESTGSVIGDDIADLDEEESSLSKLSGGRAMKTYSKKQTIAVDCEPDIETSGENADYRAWKKAVVLMYNRLATHKYASIFLRPITEDQAPGYHSVIFRPMDLSTIKKNIDNGTIRTTMHFQRDVMLMFQNAIMYNKHDTFVYKMAVAMQEECLQHMQILVQVTGEGQLRRETRTAASSSSETSDTSVKRKRSHITPSPHDSESPRGKKRRKSEND